MSYGPNEYNPDTYKYKTGNMEIVNGKLIEDIMRRLSYLEGKVRDKSQEECIWRICLFGLILGLSVAILL